MKSPLKRRRNDAVDVELQRSAEEYLLEYHIDMLARLERLPVHSVVCFSNAVDPDRDVGETRTGQLIDVLSKAGLAFEDYPIYGHQAHQEARHAHVPLLPVRRALRNVLTALRAGERLRALQLKWMVSGAIARRIVEPWQLPDVCTIPYWSEVYRDIASAHTSVARLLPDAISKEAFEAAVRATIVTPRMRAESSLRLKALHQDADFRARSKVRKSLFLKHKWASDPNFRRRMSQLQKGNKNMAQLWQIESFRFMKRQWYDDPATRAMLSANGTKSLALLRQRPDYVAKIKELHAIRLKLVWARDRETMTKYCRLGVEAYAEKLADPEYHARMVAARNTPAKVADRVAVVAAASDGKAVLHTGKFGLDAVAEALDYVLTQEPSAGLVEFAWTVRSGQETYAKRLLERLAASKPEYLPKVQLLLGNPGAGPAVWAQNVDVGVVTKLHRMKAGFSIPNLVVLNSKPTSEAAVSRALGLDSKAGRKGADAERGVSPEGVLALEREMTHIPVLRRAYVAATNSNTLQAVKDFCSRFEAAARAGADMTARPAAAASSSASPLDDVALDNFREKRADGSSDCTLCLCNIKSESWSKHEATKVHAKKVAVFKSEQGKFCRMYESRQLACTLCRGAKMNVDVWGAHVASDAHRAAVESGVQPMEGVIDDMEFMAPAQQDPELFTCKLCPRKGGDAPYPRKSLQKHCQNEGHLQKVALVRSGEAAAVEMLGLANVKCRACATKLDVRAWGAHKAQCRARGSP